MRERWLTCCFGYYAVSNYGRVKRICASVGTHAGRILKPYLHTKKGYLAVGVCLGDGVKRDIFVHCLVAEAFLGARPAGKEIDHKDGIRENNKSSNLEYVTPKENVRRAFARGAYSGRVAAHGEAHYLAKLTEVQVRRIRALHNTCAYNYVELAHVYGCTPSNIKAIVIRKSWKHV
jgi:hypothetical protein